MRILILNTSELHGGAAIAAARLTDALNHHGAKAMMLVRDKSSDRVTTSALPQRIRLRAAFLWERFRIWAANRFSRKGLWAVDIANAGADITSLPEFQDADIIHLHWVNQGLLSMDQIKRILHSGKPVVWTLHDFWPVVGICHHMLTCEHYASHCHNCPQLLHPSAHDLSWQVFRSKLNAYSNAPLTFIAVSHWEAECARKSALTGGHPIEVIPNVVPLAHLHAIDKQAARTALGIPAHAQVIVFGAARIDHPLKGFQRLLDALSILAKSSTQETPLHLILFGEFKDSDILQRIPCAFTHAGTVSSTDDLCRLYSAADVIVNASDRETFGLTLAEAMACGCTPVSFDHGGQTDIIEHQHNGYLAHFPDIDDLVAGIRWAFGANLQLQDLRDSIAQRFSEETVARHHLELYQRLLSPAGRSAATATVAQQSP